MNSFGNKIKELRESKKMLQREVAAKLEIDSAMLSKIENGDRLAKEKQVRLLSEIFDSDFQQLKAMWLADKLYEVVSGQDHGLKAIKLAEDEFMYKNKNQKIQEKPETNKMRQSELLKFLLEGPVLSEDQISSIENCRKSINLWRKK